MSNRFQFLWPAMLVAAMLGAAPAFAAEGNGQADLDKATESKLTASSINDLNEVIQLAESALKKGLDATNTEFANRLLSSAHLQRAQETAKHLFTLTNITSAEDFSQRRKLAVSDIEKSLKLDPKQPRPISCLRS